MSQMSISSQLSKNNSIRQHARSETPSQHQHSATPTPRESIVFNRGDEKPIAKILLNLNHSLKLNQNKGKNNEEDESQKLFELNYHEIESKNISQTGSVRSNIGKENNLSTSTSIAEFRGISDGKMYKEESSINNNPNFIDSNTKSDALIKSKIEKFNSLTDSSVRQNNDSYSNAIKNLVFDKNNEDNIAESDLMDGEIENLSKNFDSSAHYKPNYEALVQFEINKKKHRLRPNKASDSVENNIMNDLLNKEVNPYIAENNFVKKSDKTIILQPNGDQNFSLKKNDGNNGNKLKNESKSDISISHSFSKKCIKCCTIS
jgi:hypothetical protein